jgi:hypothetical protein
MVKIVRIESRGGFGGRRGDEIYGTRAGSNVSAIHECSNKVS